MKSLKCSKYKYWKRDTQSSVIIQSKQSSRSLSHIYLSVLISDYSFPVYKTCVDTAGKKYSFITQFKNNKQHLIVIIYNYYRSLRIHNKPLDVRQE